MNRREHEYERLDSYLYPDVDRFNTNGVLLSNEIKYYATMYKMIDPFHEDKLKAASYELSVGYEYSIGGKIQELSDKLGKDTLEIPPFQVVIIKTFETINLPRFIIARWNIRVRKAYEGLLWVGGPQVDPGWVGHLSCPIYNLSNKSVFLSLREEIAVIDFEKTTPFNKTDCKTYDRPPKRILFEDYNPDMLKSALFTEGRERMDRIEKGLQRTEMFVGFMFAAMAILFSALAIIALPNSEDVASSYKGFKFWNIISISLSIVAICIALSLRSRIEVTKKWQKITLSTFYILYVCSSAIILVAALKYIMS